MKLGSQSSRLSPLTVGRATTRTVARAISRACSVLLTGILLGYQRYLSPLKPSCTCRFVPCCSQYAIEAIRRRGPGLGTWMAAQRVLRCNPLFRGGFDPVPEPEDEHKERRPTAARLAARSR